MADFMRDTSSSHPSKFKRSSKVDLANQAGRLETVALLLLTDSNPKGEAFSVRVQNRKKPNQTGRNATSRFARLDHRLLNSPAYRALSVSARALMVELIMLHNGENNGSLYLSIRDAAGRLGMADLTAVGSAFNELKELGFIEMTEDAFFHVKAAEKSRARCWRLTWLAGPGRQGPSMAFMDCQPKPGTKAHKRMERGTRALKTFRKARDSGRLPVLDSDTEG